MNLKVVSWNIFLSKNIPGVIEELKKLDPDVIALQEVKVAGGVNAGQTIADALGYNHFYCEAFEALHKSPPFSLGNSILSRYPINESSCTLLSARSNYEGKSVSEPRSAVLTNIEGMTIVTTHMGYTPDMSFTPTQKVQLENLLKLIKEEKFVLMGDFNSLPDGEIVTTIEKRLKNTDQDKTTPTRISERDAPFVKVRIDHIFVSHDIKYSNFKIHDSVASDHTPLSVEITV